MERRARELQKSCTFDLKFTRTRSLPFSCLLPHQEEFMLRAERVLAWKERDVGLFKKPPDYIVLYRAVSFIIAIYYSPGATRTFEIPVRAFIREKHTSGRKSLTLKRASEIGREIII